MEREKTSYLLEKAACNTYKKRAIQYKYVFLFFVFLFFFQKLQIYQELSSPTSKPAAAICSQASQLVVLGSSPIHQSTLHHYRPVTTGRYIQPTQGIPLQCLVLETREG